MILALLACSDPDAPPSIAWDHAACDQCGMLVGEPASAAAIVTPGASCWKNAVP